MAICDSWNRSHAARSPIVPLDKVFGTNHDGTKEADHLLNRRLQKRRERMAAKAKDRVRS